jgi:hypothetical protein
VPQCTLPGAAHRSRQLAAGGGRLGRWPTLASHIWWAISCFSGLLVCRGEQHHGQHPEGVICLSNMLCSEEHRQAGDGTASAAAGTAQQPPQPHCQHPHPPGSSSRPGQRRCPRPALWQAPGCCAGSSTLQARAEEPTRGVGEFQTQVASNRRVATPADACPRPMPCPAQAHLTGLPRWSQRTSRKPGLGSLLAPREGGAHACTVNGWRQGRRRQLWRRAAANGWWQAGGRGCGGLRTRAGHLLASLTGTAAALTRRATWPGNL